MALNTVRHGRVPSFERYNKKREQHCYILTAVKRVDNAKSVGKKAQLNDQNRFLALTKGFENTSRKIEYLKWQK